MAQFVLSRNGEESLNKFLSQNPDRDLVHIRRGQSHGDNILYVKKSNQSEQYFFE